MNAAPATHGRLVMTQSLCAVRVTLCVSGIVRAVHQSSSKLGDTPLVRLDLFESLPSRRVCCRASTTNSTAKSRSTVLYICIALSRAGCRALQLYSAPHLYISTALYTLHPLHPPSGSCRSSGSSPMYEPDLRRRSGPHGDACRTDRAWLWVEGAGHCSPTVVCM